MNDGPEWDYWPCACTRTYQGRRQFKQLHRSVNRCRTCKVERPSFIAPTREAGEHHHETGDET